MGSRERRLAAVVLGIFALSMPRGATADPVEIIPHLSVSEEYNDNIFFSDDRREDYVTSVSPGLSLHYRRPTLTISLSGTSSAQFFARQSQEDDVARTQSGQLSGFYTASPRLSISLSDGVTRVGATRTGIDSGTTASTPPTGNEPPPGGSPTTEPLDPSASVSTLLPRGSALSNHFAASARYQLAPRWSGSVNYRNALANFTDPGDSNLTNSLGATLAYSWAPTLSLSGTYTYSHFDLTTGADTETHSASLGAGYGFAPSWSASASAGIFVNRSLESDGDGISDSVGPTFNVALTKLFEHSSATAGGSQQVTTSAGVGGVSITRTAFLSCGAQVWRDLSASLGASYADFDTSRADFKVVQTTAHLAYPLVTNPRWPRVYAGLRYSYRWRDSDREVTDILGEGTVDGNVVSIHFTASYPLWRGDL